MTTATVKRAAFWATTIFGPASFVMGGTLNLAHASQAIDTLTHLGYPAYFAWILGVGKLFGALAIVAPGLPRLKEWAYAGFFFNLSAAAFSRAAVGDSTADIVAPLAFLALVLASWMLRPESRRLASPHAASQPAWDGLKAVPYIPEMARRPLHSRNGAPPPTFLKCRAARSRERL